MSLIDALDLRSPEKVALANRLKEDGGFDWGFPPAPDVSFDLRELMQREIDGLAAWIDAATVELAGIVAELAA